MLSEKQFTRADVISRIKSDLTQDAYIRQVVKRLVDHKAEEKIVFEHLEQLLMSVDLFAILRSDSRHAHRQQNVKRGARKNLKHFITRIRRVAREIGEDNYSVFCDCPSSCTSRGAAAELSEILRSYATRIESNLREQTLQWAKWNTLVNNRLVMLSSYIESKTGRPLDKEVAELCENTLRIGGFELKKVTPGNLKRLRNKYPELRQLINPLRRTAKR